MVDPTICSCPACSPMLAEGSQSRRMLEAQLIAEAMDGFYCFLMNVLTAVALKATFAYGFTTGIQAERHARIICREF